MNENKINLDDKQKNWIYYSLKNDGCPLDIILENIKFYNKFLFIIDLRSFDLHDKLKIDDSLYVELEKFKKYSKDNNLQFIVVLEHCYEAPSYKHNLFGIINLIKVKCNLKDADIVSVSSAHYFDNTKIAHALIYNFTGSKEIFKNTSSKILPKHHFISLARLARSHRIAATVEILDRNLDKFGYCSCGSGYYNTPEENDFSYLPDHLRHRFPMYIDGSVSGENKEKYNCTSSNMKFAFVNIVMETSYEKKFNYLNFTNMIWHLPYNTEKSIKPFAWGQVPIFIAMKDNDLVIRDLGFDLFDDIIDHQYMKEPDPYKRITLAIDQLDSICQKPIEHWINFKKNNQHRFKYNRLLAKKISKTQDILSAKNLQKILDNLRI